ncbi:MAG: AAA family ATPase [Anaerolineae bacterium]|jgi:SpoVK/Ycf46/Vps4 family AAA+-type ATPase
MLTDQAAELELLIKARYPLIYITSWDEPRIEDMLRGIAGQRRKRLFAWTVTSGVVAIDTLQPTPIDPSAVGPMQALEHVAEARDAAIFLFKDFHRFLAADLDPENARVVRKLRDLARTLKRSEKTLIFLSPLLRLPPELEKEINVLDFALPTLDELSQALERVIRSAHARAASELDLDLKGEEQERVLKAARGLTVSEAEKVFAKSVVLRRGLDLDVIIAEKKQLIRKSGILEYTEPIEHINHVGGLIELKRWLGKRRMAFSERARQFGLPEPRGLLLLGVPGGGKSLVAKATASLWQLPLLRLDMGKVFSQMVGSSEENIRSALRMAETVSPAVLWLDEIEKGLAGTISSHRSDAGTAARVFGSFLIWLQEKTAPVFVIATSNNINLLPPELLRKGRFDEIFFVDLPSSEEREEIFAIHLDKRYRDPNNFDLLQLARVSEGFSGAEIEQAIIAGLYEAFDNGERDLSTQDLLDAIQATIPLSRTMREQMTALRNWARTHARQASQQPQAQVAWG